MSSICGVIGYKGEKNCFLSLPKGSVTNETHEEVIVFEVLLEGRPSVYCSWAGETTSGHGRSEGVILLNGLYANKLGIPEDTPVVLRRLSGIPECSSLWVEPMSVDDWEILELNSQKVESGLLGQVRVVWTGQPLPVWLKNNFCIFVNIRDIAPPGKCALLVNNTEVIVSPKSRGGGSMSDRAINQNTSNRTAKPSPASSDIGRKDFNPAVPSTKSESGLLNSWTTYLKSFVVAKDKMHTKSQENETVFKEGRHFILPKNFKCGFRAQCLCMEGDAAVYTCPTNVFVLCKDLARHIRPKCSLPDVMFARVTKLLSPELKRKETEAKDSDKPKGENSSNETSRSSPAQKEKANKSQTSPPVVIVRVIVVNKYNFRGSPEFRNLVKAATGLQPVVEGHVLTSDFLRRQLSVGVTDQVQLEPVYSSPQFVREIELFQISDLPSRITSEMVVAAFRSWLKRTVSDGPPMVVFQQMLARFPILPELDLEVLLTFDLPEGREFGVITAKPRRNINITAHLRSNGQRKWPQISHNPITSARELDPPVPMVMLANLGGVSSLIPKALSHLEVCFAQRPLTQLVFPHLDGVRIGALLLTGVSGTGKSSFGKALCRRVAEYPYLAYTSVVECKTLKGKRPETVQTLLERVFDESSWRQPAVVLLDDVDVLAGAPTSADAEMTGKAHYANKMAEVVRTVLKTSAELGDTLAVILTSKSRGSLHASLLPPRGQQVIHQVINMPAPTQAERKEILECILKSKRFVSRDCLSDLPLEDLSARMEGFVAQDVRTVVDRAIHAHQMSGYKPKTEPDGLLLCTEDFETALSGFKPTSYRNVSLHEETEVGWADVGGLQDVKATLIETLQWPTKYPRLFEACPLRLRSGLLLFGAPGTGKTLLARAVARECKLNFITIKGPELLSKYIGASEQAVRDTFARAHSAKPCILFFDEFDSIAPRRGHDSTGVTDRVVNQLLTQLDGVEALEGVFVLGATSRPDLIDPALLRPGRLDKCLYCRLPSAEERSEILSCLAKKMKFAEDVNLKEIAISCEHFTGADFKALLYNAQLEAIHEITPVLKNNVPVSSIELEKRTEVVCKSVPSILESCETRELIHQEQLVMSQDKKPTLAYFPCLENGPVPLEAREERRWLEQVNEFKGRQTKLKLIGTQSDRITKRQAYSENKTSHMIEVNQSHLLRAFQGMRPSVSANERLKFEKIYSNFVSTRGGDFEADALSTKRLTLA